MQEEHSERVARRLEEAGAPSDDAPDTPSDTLRRTRGFTSESARAAVQKRWARQRERDAQAADGARRGDGEQERDHTVARQLDLGAIVLDEIARDEGRLRKYISGRMQKGGDLPATLLRAVELFTARAAAEPPMARTVAEIDAMSTADLKAYIGRLEAESAAG